MTGLASPLHPAGNVDDKFDDILTPTDTTPIAINIYELATAIIALPDISASGATGTTFKLLKQLYRKEAYNLLHLRENTPPSPNPASGINLLLKFYQMLLARDLNDREMKRILMSRLILLPKPNGGIRPIAIGDSTLRLLLRVVNNKVAKIVGRKLEPHQVAVGTSGGCEIMAALCQHTLEQGTGDTDNRAVKSIDLPNAFNLINRRSIASGLREYCPELLELFRITYDQPAELRAHTTDGRGQLIGLSEKGCRQGDPLSMLYFSVGIHPALLAIHDTLTLAHLRANVTYAPTVIAYADDMTLHGKDAVIVTCMTDIDHHIKDATGITSNLAKSRLMGKGVTDLILPPQLDGLDCNEHGGKIVGVPIGTEVTRHTASAETLAKQNQAIDVVSNHTVLSNQTKFALLRHCVNAKPHYLCRNVYPPLIREGLNLFDEHMDNALAVITGCPLDDKARVLRGLPTQLGGCGLRRHCGMQSVNDYNSRNNLISSFAIVHLPEFAATLNETPTLPLNAAAPNPPENEDNSPTADLSTELKQTHRDLLTSTLVLNLQEGAKHNAWIRSGSLSSTSTHTFSGGWLRWMGGNDQRWTMKDNVFTNALRARLCLPDCNMHLACANTGNHAQNQQDEFIDLHEIFHHSVLCYPAPGVARYIKYRHDYVVQALKQLLSDVIFPDAVTPEAALRLEVDTEKKDHNDQAIVADILWVEHYNSARENRTFIDVAVVSPCGIDGTGRDDGFAATHAASAKQARYAEVDDAENTTFIPFILETNGCIGSHACSFLSQLSKRDPRNSARINQFVTQLSYIVAKMTATASEEGVKNALAASTTRFEPA